MYKTSMFNNIFNSPEGKYQIYNSYTKACIEVDNPDYIDELLKKQEDNNQFGVLNELYKNGFVVNKECDEISLLKYSFNKRYFSENSMGLILMPTLLCNFSCPYCFEKPSSHLIRKTDPNYFEAVENYIGKSVNRISALYLNWFGGEPLLEKESIIEFSKRVRWLADENNITLGSTIVTNGSLVDERVLDALACMNCSLIQITIDGTKESHDKNRIFKNGRPTFDLLMDKIRFVAEYLSDNREMELLVRINLNNVSCNELSDTLEKFPLILRSRISLLFRPIFNTNDYHITNSNMREDINKFNLLAAKLGYKVYKNKRLFLSCEACGDTNVIHVLPDLSLWKCVNDFSFDDARIGSLNQDGVASWDANKVLAWYNYADFLETPECRKCSYSPDCLGGCIRNYALKKKRKCASLEVLSSPYCI